jgi:importin-7
MELTELHTHWLIDREEALKDDFPLEDSYSDGDDISEGSWAGGDGTQWTEDDPEENDDNVKDESSAYLDFLNEEASYMTSVRRSH